jgi:hypothetical protein
LYICERKQHSKDELCSEKVPSGAWTGHGEILYLRSRSEKVSAPLGVEASSRDIFHKTLARSDSKYKGHFARRSMVPCEPSD